jgi:uncharacterized membrane protein (UPF0127 family)
MTGRRAAVQTLLLVIAALALPAAAPGSDERVKLDALPLERIVLETRGSGPHDYRAWRADTPETRSRGLMYVAALAEDQAMIFIYDEPQIVSMWMKNTYLPLDMLFVDARGCIVKIAERTKPLSLASIESGKPVVLVVEIKGGGAAAVGAKAGDRLRRPDVGWPASLAGC